MEVTLHLCPQIRCVYLAFRYGRMSKRTSRLLLTREECILCAFYLKFYVILTDAAVFQKTSMGAVLLGLQMFQNIWYEQNFFLTFTCLHFSVVLLPVGMSTQGEIFQGLKWKQKPSWWFTLARNPLEVCQMHKNDGSILHLKGQIFLADGIRHSPLKSVKVVNTENRILSILGFRVCLGCLILWFRQKAKMR